MEETYLCPDCHTEHAEAAVPVLGHLARCLECAMLLEVLAEERAFYAEVIEIRIAA
jgi:hypothetical protein